MDSSYEKKWPNEAPSSLVLIDGPNIVRETPVRIRHHFVFSLFSVICLCPATGLIALAYSLKSSAKADVKFHDKARLYSRRALLWNIISVIFAVLSFILCLAFFYRLAEMTKTQNYRMNMYMNQQMNERSNDVDRLIHSITNN